MRFHVVGLPHTITSKSFLSCAYTQKILNFIKMMKSLGHEVYHYGGEGAVNDATENIVTITGKQRQQWFGNVDISKDFYPIEWSPTLPYWIISNANAVAEIQERLQPKDFICVIAGDCQKQVADAFPNHMVVEYGVGYEGIFSKYRVFESYAHMHYVYGKKGIIDGNYYDTVIPNYFDPEDFYVSEKKEDYFLYIGRLVKRKGIDIAAEVSKKLGMKLKIAGQGMVEYTPGKLVSKESTIEGDIEYVGTVGVQERAKLMSKARLIFVETQYIGPFEGVSIEAMLSGTPVLSTDWGCFAENNIDGVTGYRTRSFGETLWAAKACERLSPRAIRNHALERFSIDVVRHRYQDYFTQLLTLWDKGWYTEEYDPIDKRLIGNFR